MNILRFDLMLSIYRYLEGIFVTLLFTCAGLTAERVAFIVGNDNYPTAPLENAVRDATALRQMLGNQLGFRDTDIHFSTNVDRLGFFESFETFSKAARDADIVLFYFAGHGMESIDGRENFILPVDADVKRAAQSEAALRATGINLMTLSADLAAKSRGAKVMLMDACRERPAGRGLGNRSGGGLAVYEDKRIPADTLIMLAAAPNRVASDGKNHGPFTEALLEVLPQRGQDLMDSFFAVSDRVQEMTQKQQIPWLKFDGSGKIFRTRYFLDPDDTGTLAKTPMKPVVRQQLTAADRLRGATREAPFVNSLGMEFIPVPGRPGIYMCRKETRVRDFQAFVNATGYDATRGAETMETGGFKDAGGSWLNPRFPGNSPQTPEHPVSCVSWQDGREFCRWLTGKEANLRYRLPLDMEWSAAVGTDGKYPWGNQYPPPRGAGNYPGEEAKVGSWTNGSVIRGYNDGASRTARVASYKPNRYGFYDLGGNVYEWCEDHYRSSMNDPDMVRQFTFLQNENSDDGVPFRVLRGGCWCGFAEICLRSSGRFNFPPTSRNGMFGFRVVAEVDSDF
ncbi:MAG: SUMF1/EgtB/PvdO family nonheme iron enzyme [Verrucomicrobiales bacterium]|nr:SUMF1/EgtB/PvdO family nonheme iron enzyme [Verrucomicrobiales bacterium]